MHKVKHSFFIFLDDMELYHSRVTTECKNIAQFLHTYESVRLIEVSLYLLLFFSVSFDLFYLILFYFAFLFGVSLA